MPDLQRDGPGEGKVKHEIPRHINNSTIEFLIRERVRNAEHREMLREKWFGGMSLYQIAERHKCSLTHVKDVIYGFGDPLLLEAAELDAKD